jgi:hypothetical protein
MVRKMEDITEAYWTTGTASIYGITGLATST